ncbi:hypothetical protein Tco_0912316 [Tanacetum coccineum]
MTLRMRCIESNMNSLRGCIVGILLDGNVHCHETYNNPPTTLSDPHRYVLEDIYTMQIVMENPNHFNEPNKAIPEVNPVVPEPNQVVDIHDPNEMVDIPDDIDLVDYDEEDPEEDPEEEPDGDKTPPPGDVSFDFMSSNSESEDEEVDVAPEATAGTITQKPYATHTFLRALWALRHDLEVSRARAREMEAKWGTCQTEIALLKSKNKIREKERELLNHDLENVEYALGNVLERVSVLESGENATLKKRLAETKTKLEWARMERDMAERRLHVSQGWNKRFYMEMVRIRGSSLQVVILSSKSFGNIQMYFVTFI